MSGPGRPRAPARRRAGQRGAALILAMLVLTLVSTLAAGMVWQQWRAVRVETAERARTQAAWILVGALDWARLILREDGRTGAVDHLGEPWAVPLAEARLSTFLAADRERSADDGPEAFLSGRIEDVHTRYNLRNLFDEGQVRSEELALLQRLCVIVGLSADVADRLAAALRDAAGESAAAPLTPRSLDDFAWAGLDAETLDKLRPYVVLLPLPGRTLVNLNTAPREVVAAAIDGLDLAGAQRIIETRERKPLRSPEEVRAFVGGQPDLRHVGVGSSHFWVHARLRLGERVLEERSLVQRRQAEVLVLHRERLNRHLEPAR